MSECQEVVTGVYSRSNIESAAATDGINKTGSSEMNSDITNGNVFKNADSFRLQSFENSARKNTTVHTLIPEEPLEIQCGEKSALLFVSKLCQGSKGPCILYGSEWLTPNELQYICGRETAKDWKRSIRHKGKSLKSLIAQGFLKVHPPICDCPGCRVSSPVNRTRLADKCGFSKLPSYLAEKSMAEGFPTMWRRSSTSSDEPEQAKLESLDDEALPQRSHSDDSRFYRPDDQVQVAKRPRSSSPDLDRDRVNIKRRCMSETEMGKSTGSLKSRLSPSSAGYDMESNKKCDVIDLDMKLQPGAIRGPIRRDLPVLTLPSSAYTASVLYGHNQPHIGLHRHVTSPRLLSPSFVRPSVNSPAQIRLLHEQAVAPSHIFAHQLRHDFPGMATMFPYPFTHPLQGNPLLTSHLKKVSEVESDTRETSETLNEKQNERCSKENEPNATENSLSPNSEATSSPKNAPENLDKSRSASDENLKFSNEEGESQSNTRIYPDLANIAAQWDIEEVCKFVSSVTGCSEYCDVFREQEIDGQALILLTEEHLSNKMGLKLGPALKLKSKIDELRCVFTK
ncbi:uncharacterized protein LOC114518466 [Dendronephthya gigantea]|uniref:uncharacterized protein LOC114518466 n=1 Tax=Dendronephthya gigantea TaxID=151771 RepID=UPI00106A73EC|nr:uncharacterized protein LOC114518466 [Dendronephthya gigantea]